MEKTYLKGLFTKKPHQNAPDFIKAKISIKRLDLIEELQSRSEEYINLDMKEGKDGSYYTQIDTWKPSVGAVVTEPLTEQEF